MNLFEIDQKITDCVDLETGEIIDMEMLQELQMEREQKIRNVILWIKNLRADAEALKAQKDAFAARQKATENKIDSLKQYLSATIAGENIKAVEYTISWRKTVGTDIVDAAAIPDEFLIKQEPKVDRASILAALKHGAIIPGVQLKESIAMTLK